MFWVIFLTCDGPTTAYSNQQDVESSCGMMMFECEASRDPEICMYSTSAVLNMGLLAHKLAQENLKWAKRFYFGLYLATNKICGL